MRILLQIGLCCLTAGSMMAQGRGGGMGGGGARGGGGGIRGGGIGGGFRGGGIGGGLRGGGIGGYRPGGIGTGFRGGFYGGYRTGWYGYGGLGYGFGYGNYPYGLGLLDYPYYGYDYGYSPYVSAYPSEQYPVYEYNTSPNVTIIYPAAQDTPPAYVQPAQPVMRTYDNYGQESQPGASSTGAPAGPASSPIYLIATKDQTIRAAASYWVDGNTLHYVTLQHQEKQVPLDTVDRDFSLQLNRERRVPFQLPQ